MEEEESCQLCGGPLDGIEEDACPSCLLNLGIDTDESGFEESSDEVPKMLESLPPDIKVLDFIGRGGMGVVYKARQIELDRIVAVKILSPQLASEPEFAVRFMREAQLMAKLNHPNIVTVHNFGSTDGFCYLVMEYVSGELLADIVSERQLTPHEALSLGAKISAAVSYAHSQDVIHRDIKPENILLDEVGNPKVTDFGLAKLVDGNPKALGLTMPAQSLGTPYYMAPEQRDDPMGTDARADVYALGVTLYQLLTGQLPNGRFPMPSEAADVSQEVDGVIMKAMQTDRDLRYSDAGEVHDALTNISGLISGTSFPKPATASKSVFLAFTSGDMEPARERIRLHLINRGHRILPSTPALPLNAPQAEASIRSALMAADIAIHPIGRHYGWIPDESERSIVDIQHILASEQSKRQNLRRLIWMPPGFHTTDDRLRRLVVDLQQEANRSPNLRVITATIEDFFNILHEELSESMGSSTLRPSSVRTPAPHVYLINHQTDEKSADRVEDYFFDLGFEIIRPASTLDSREVADAHRRNLAACDAVLLFYGDAPKPWIDMNLLDIKDATTCGRVDDLSVRGILIAPPMDRNKQRFRTHIAEVMRLESEFVEVALEPFVVEVAASRIDQD
jgi:serine/threonine protein kinase